MKKIKNVGTVTFDTSQVELQYEYTLALNGGNHGAGWYVGEPPSTFTSPNRTPQTSPNIPHKALRLISEDAKKKMNTTDADAISSGITKVSLEDTDEEPRFNCLLFSAASSPNNSSELFFNSSVETSSNCSTEEVLFEVPTRKTTPWPIPKHKNRNLKH